MMSYLLFNVCCRCSQLLSGVWSIRRRRLLAFAVLLSALREHVLCIASRCAPAACDQYRPLLRDAAALTGSPAASQAFRELLESSAPAVCPLAGLLQDLGWLYFIGPERGPVLPYRGFLRKLMRCDLDGDTLFSLVHLSRPQMAYAYWFMLQETAQLPRWLSPELGAHERGAIFDFGTNRGYDSGFYLALNHSVMAVDAHPRTEELLIESLRPAVRSGRLTVLNRALVGPGGPASVAFYVCKEDTRSTTDPALGDNPEWCESSAKVDVAAATCGDLVREVVSVYFAKIDVEGADLECLETLLHGSTRSDAKALPPFVSVEMAMGHGGRTDIEMSGRLLQGLVDAGYSRFKLCRQALFNPPFWGGWLAGSGPFGDAATDWRKGLTWRSAEAVLADLSEIGQLRDAGGLVAEWFDLHAARGER
eukprot:TRINITY_DN30054_c0_g1_i2.p1 TRINITY_DN30054_c0_g1~~TRINITY_DN30054_c0_g1_i2.p1  ORF type:complete len:421 (-),score=56.49 TRINITY_DN30054_c0_g1_i2:174-1436(-)